MGARRMMAIAGLVGVVFLGGVTPAGAVESRGRVTHGTWVGAVQAHGRHFDYVGSPCPIEAEVCAALVVTYRIVPTTREAARALPAAAGHHPVRLEGFLVPRADGGHQGTLYVREVVVLPV